MEEVQNLEFFSQKSQNKSTSSSTVSQTHYQVLFHSFESATKEVDLIRYYFAWAIQTTQLDHLYV